MHCGVLGWGTSILNVKIRLTIQPLFSLYWRFLVIEHPERHLRVNSHGREVKQVLETSIFYPHNLSPSQDEEKCSL
jgi:hypothetical protein